MAENGFPTKLGSEHFFGETRHIILQTKSSPPTNHLLLPSSRLGPFFVKMLCTVNFFGETGIYRNCPEIVLKLNSCKSNFGKIISSSSI